MYLPNARVGGTEQPRKCRKTEGDIPERRECRRITGAGAYDPGASRRRWSRAALAQDARSTKPKPIVIAEQGDFYVGGQVVFSPANSSSGENGNSHMMKTTNLQVADLVIDWIRQNVPQVTAAGRIAPAEGKAGEMCVHSRRIK